MEQIMRHIRFAAVIGTAAITAAELAALAGCGTTTTKAPAAAATPATAAAAATPADPSYSYYQAMMEHQQPATVTAPVPARYIKGLPEVHRGRPHAG
jgi:hypothetical protein